MRNNIQALRPTFYVFVFIGLFPLFAFCFGLSGYVVIAGFASGIGVLPLCFGAAMFLWASAYTYLIAFRRPCRGLITKSTGALSLGKLFGSPVTIPMFDLVGFSTCHTPFLWTRNLPTDGVVLYFKQGGVIELSRVSLEPMHQLINNLTNYNVPHIGEERSWYPLKKRKYKYEP